MKATRIVAVVGAFLVIVGVLGVGWCWLVLVVAVVVAVVVGGDSGVGVVLFCCCMLLSP